MGTGRGKVSGFPYSAEGAITSSALGPLSSERWEPFLLVLSFTRIREKGKKRTTKEKEHTHTHKATAVIGGSRSRGCAVARQRGHPQSPEVPRPSGIQPPRSLV